MNDDLRAFAVAAQLITENMRAVSEAFTREISDALQPIREHYYQAYFTAGAPYGETHEGMIQWMGERRAILDQGRDKV